MKRNVRNVVLLLMLITLLLGLLGGCCFTCCPPIQEWTVEITGQKPYCIEENGVQKGFLADMRNIAPLAYPRNSVKPISNFTSLETTQKVIGKLEGKDIINEFLSFPGCEKIPFGIIKYFNGDEDYVVAAMETNSEVEFYILGPGNVLVKIYPNNYISEIYFY